MLLGGFPKFELMFEGGRPREKCMPTYGVAGFVTSWLIPNQREMAAMPSVLEQYHVLDV